MSERGTILVTGGGGFIGSNLVEALLRAGRRVRVLDDFSTGHRSNLEDADEWARAGGGTLEVVQGSICDAAVVGRAMSEVDAVLHHAAISSVPRSVEDPLLINEVGVRGTLLLLLAARERRVRRFVYASSSAVYGESEELPKRESMPVEPISPYGIAKLAAERYVNIFHRLYGMGTLSLRYFNVFGPRQDPASEYAAVVPRFIRAILEGRSPVIYGDGKQTRDFNPVANVVEANLRAIEAPDDVCGRAYNIAGGIRISLQELIDRLAALAEVQVTPVHEPPRPGDIRHSLASISAARSALGYVGKMTLHEGFKIVLDYYARDAGRTKDA